MNTLDNLVYMANQIARNFGTLDRDAAAEATAEHILLFWDPRMKSRIIAHVAHVADGAGADLSEVAALAITMVAEKTQPSAAATEA